jgi:hypothetical protein
MVGAQSAYGLKILSYHLYYLQGPENISVLWKYSTGSTTSVVQSFVLKTVFNMPTDAIKSYTLDTSGIQRKSSCDVPLRNRIDYLTHQSFHKFLHGEKLLPLFDLWSALFVDQLKTLNISNEWVTIPDIMEYWLLPSTASMNRAFMGTMLDAINPNFHRDFLEFIPYGSRMMLGLPRWCLPRAHALQRSLTRDVRQWHAIARSRFQESDIKEDGSDPWWGSEFIRDRHDFLQKVDSWDDDAIATSDFSLLWGYGHFPFLMHELIFSLQGKHQRSSNGYLVRH